MNRQRTFNQATFTKPTIVDVKGQQVPLFGNVDGANPLAIVDLGVLQAITSKMPKAHFGEIKSDFIQRMSDVYDIENYINLLSLELRFHLTVNQIEVYEPEVVEPA